MSKNDYIQVVTAVDKKAEGKIIAEQLVKEKLAACVQLLGPVESIYFWDDKLACSEEWLCLIKSRKDIYKRIEKRLIELHSYDEPEILVFPVVKGSLSYLEWIDSQICSEGSGDRL